MICLDTHVWIRWVLDPVHLPGPLTRRLESDETCISMISVWEAALLVALGKLRLNRETSAFLTHALQWEGVSVVGITPEIAVRGSRFGPAFSRDPADRIITATAIELGVPLATHDGEITRSGVVEVLWD